MRTKKGIFFVLTLLFSFCLLAPLSAADSQQGSVYRLGAGDKLGISVFNQEDLSDKYTINGVGRFSMPLIGSVDAAGLTVPELEALLIGKLKPDYLLNPRISIEVLNYRPFYILGEVQEPSSYPYVDGMTYLNAVAIAGGFTYRAKKDYALVKRGDDPNAEEVKVDISNYVMPGDIIRIDERLF